MKKEGEKTIIYRDIEMISTTMQFYYPLTTTWNLKFMTRKQLSFNFIFFFSDEYQRTRNKIRIGRRVNKCGSNFRESYDTQICCTKKFGVLCAYATDLRRILSSKII